MSRRGLLRAAGSAAALAALPRVGLSEEAAPGASGGFRIAHLTDMHVQPELKAEEGFRKCLAAVHDLKPRPELILTGGDLVMDSLATPEARVKKLFDLYTSICKDSDIPIRHCIGNHDVFGWSSDGKVSKEHPQYGKKMAQERLDLPQTTYSFDHKGWHICMVDDILPAENGYIGGISEEDLAWLDADLTAAGDKPKLIVTHIPIVSVVIFRNVDATKDADVKMPRGAVCQNPGPIYGLLRKHKVKLVLAGHLHDNEVLRYEYTTHVGEGAVSGAWWKGPQRLSPEGFGVVDLKPDGGFEHQYLTYGWKAAQA
ncbi:MAG: metallophosphoesterase [Phycisphaerae bacterium]|jgi:3',5'-cyclic AMP phosphodiesterase CpdA